MMGVRRLVLLLALTGCRPDGPDIVVPADSVPVPARGFYMGVLPMPAEGQSIEEAYFEAARYCEFCPAWGRPSPFDEFGEDLEGWWGETFVEGLIRGNGMFPLVQMSFIDAGLTLRIPPGLEGATLRDSAWRAAYRQATLDIVRAARPKYISLGNEVNRWYEKYGTEAGNENGFQHFVSLYHETHDAVRELSPDIVAFCIFSREVVGENREAGLEVLDLFDPDRLDLLVLTSYPHSLAGVNRPADIRDDYYAQAAAKMPGKPFGFSEVAWPSMDEFGGEQAQSDFVDALATRLTSGQGLELRLLGWPWSTDLDEDDRTGLIRRDGTQKPAYSNWQRLSGR